MKLHIRAYEKADKEYLDGIHQANGLPPQCLPDFDDPLILHTGVVDVDGKPVMSCSIRGTSELFLLVDHQSGTPEERWQWMKELREYIVREAWLLGLDEMSCWIPAEIEESFADRLIELGFLKSPWSCYTLRLEK